MNCSYFDCLLNITALRGQITHVIIATEWLHAVEQETYMDYFMLQSQSWDVNSNCKTSLPHSKSK